MITPKKTGNVETTNLTLPTAATRREIAVGREGRMDIRVGVIGYGYWGPNLVRNLAEADGARLVRCVDMRPERRALAVRRFPSVKVDGNPDAILDDPAIDAVVIATPVSTHYNLAKRALEQGKHVLIEKPMTETSAEAVELIAIAEKRDVVIMTDHTFVYTGAVQKMKEIITSGELGEILYFDSVRVNLGVFQHDVDVLWDLAPHDLAILTYALPQTPKFVSAVGADHTGSGHVDIAYLTVYFENNFLAHLHLNWLSPVKMRRILIGGRRRMLVYDEMEPSEKVRVYDRGIQVTTQEGIYGTLVDYRTGDMWAPKLDVREALATECDHFLDCVRFRKIPLTGGAPGLRVVKLLEAAARSLANNGRKTAV
jgi:predicted dehydrogenase